MSTCDNLKWGRVSEFTSNMCLSMCCRGQIFYTKESEIWPIDSVILSPATHDTMEMTLSKWMHRIMMGM